MASRPCRAALVVLLGVLVAGCGADPEPPGTPDATTTDGTDTAAPEVDVDRFLLQPDEVPGMTPGLSPFTDTGEPFDLPDGGAEVLERSGYVSTTYQTAQGAHGAGVSSVLLFESEAGARDWMAYEISDAVLHEQLPDSELTRFEVPEVPGATGWTGPDLHGNAIGTVYWTQGRCLLVISIETKGPRVRPLSVGAQGIYERTDGTCPD
jgi:hypothetical protein